MASNLEPSLEQGVVALKQKDYSRAIAILESLLEGAGNDVPRPQRIKAQQLLVQAYQGQGDIQKAIGLCQSLAAIPHPPLQAWAEKILATLQNQTSTGFTTSATPVQTASQEPLAAPETPLENPGEDRAVIPYQTAVPGDLGEQWRNAGRAKKWKRLKPVPQERLWLLHSLTVITLFWVLHFLFKGAMDWTNAILGWLPWLNPISLFYEDPTYAVVGLLLLLAGASPWLLDWGLRYGMGLMPWSGQKLRLFSPEASRLLANLSDQRRIPFPQLRLLPISTPLAFSYGHLPRFTRIVVSQGLLDRLQEDEIAVICAGEYGHILTFKPIGLGMAGILLLLSFFFALFQDENLVAVTRWLALMVLPMGLNGAVMSLLLLLMQIPYTLYQQLSIASDQFKYPILRWVGGAVASISYGIFWLLNWLGLWLGRRRMYYSDRVAVEETGNPNAMVRALLKLSLGITKEIQAQGYTPWELQRFDLVAPLGYRQGLTYGSVYPQTSFEAVLRWDRLSPYRQWLAVNDSHPLLGDRIYLLGLYSRHWKLDSEIDFEAPVRSLPQVTLPKAPNPAFPTRQGTLLQGAPYFGVLFGIGLGMVLWLVGWVSSWFYFSPLRWLMEDASSVFIGSMAIGLSLGTIIRINYFFPDITPKTLTIQPYLPSLYTRLNTLPLDSYPVRLEGKLLGKKGVSNWLGQDLILQTENVLIRLHHLTTLGAVGNFFRQPRPSDGVEQSVTVTGWFRRGAVPWIDIDQLKISRGPTIPNNHPVWSTILAIAAALWGAYIIRTGL